MCALNAKNTKERGKNKKLAVIVKCDKLLKQVFGVEKSSTKHQKNNIQEIS